MTWAVYVQRLDPLDNRLLSTVVAAMPVVVLFWLLVPRRWLAPKAGVAGVVTAFVLAWLVYGMPADMAAMSFVHGVAFGLLPVGQTVFAAMLLYNCTVETGHFNIVRRSVSGISSDARIQAILIGFSFGAFLEGAAGAGTPVAICGAIMVGLGFHPFLAAVLCLIANTSPVAYGGLGTPLLTLHGVTGIPTETLSVMAGHQLPLVSFFVPAYMVKVMCSWKQTFEVWPALAVGGGSFALFQYAFATMHEHVGVVLYPMTDIGGGIFSLVVTAIFLRFWRPKQAWHFDQPAEKEPASVKPPVHLDAHAAEAAALLATPAPEVSEKPLTPWSIALAWAPYLLMSILLVLTGLIRQKEDTSYPVMVGPVQTNYRIPIPRLDGQVERDRSLREDRDGSPQRERAVFNFAWVTSPGSAVLAAAILSMPMLRMSRVQVWRVLARTVYQMRIPIPTIACMLGLSYITRYAGMDATLGVAFAETGWIYPFFAAILGWLGVFLTGTDAGSNALFGSLQKITATKVFESGVFSHLTQAQAQVLICTANSTGGVMGKMIDAQSICVATAATHQLGKEADIFKAVIWHSIILAAVIGLMTLVQAYVYPFTGMVPSPR
ncbi:MAG: L-lactate permease [Gemmataceae bacterium]|nr:L-lactate permease [Gemmataceae bacterium]MDW8266150.1 L-lactate permease [Gemmataceae bacterium]